jgi:hypothetical protein
MTILNKSLQFNLGYYLPTCLHYCDTYLLERTNYIIAHWRSKYLRHEDKRKARTDHIAIHISHSQRHTSERVCLYYKILYYLPKLCFSLHSSLVPFPLSVHSTFSPSIPSRPTFVSLQLVSMPSSGTAQEIQAGLGHTRAGILGIIHLELGLVDI